MKASPEITVEIIERHKAVITSRVEQIQNAYSLKLTIQARQAAGDKFDAEDVFYRVDDVVTFDPFSTAPKPELALCLTAGNPWEEHVQLEQDPLDELILSEAIHTAEWYLGITVGTPEAEARAELDRRKPFARAQLNARAEYLERIAAEIRVIADETFAEGDTANG